jgi:hypothetical protein
VIAAWGIEKELFRFEHVSGGTGAARRATIASSVAQKTLATHNFEEKHRRSFDLCKAARELSTALLLVLE